MAWLTVQEAAELLRVPVSWHYERPRTHRVPHVKLGKYVRCDRDELGRSAKQMARPACDPTVHRYGDDAVLDHAHARSPRLAELNPHLSLAQLVNCAVLSVPTPHGDLDGPPGETLSCYRIRGKTVVKSSEYDGWVQQSRSSRRPQR